MKVTIRQVAELAGVSAGTVSNVMRNSKSVRAESRRRVLAAVEALDYRADPAASVLRSGRSRVIAAIVPNMQNPFFQSLLAAIEQQCAADGFGLLVASSNNDEATETARIRSLLAWRPAGLFTIPCTARFPSRSFVEASNVPHLLADRDIDDRDLDFVEIDNVEAGRMAGRHLKSLGHSKYCVLAPNLAVGNIRRRIDGIEAELGAPLRSIEIGHEWMRLDVRSIACEWPAQATAAVALTNSATLRALAALGLLGMRVPDEVSLVGFDDYEWMSLAAPSITAFKQPVAEMGRLAWEALRARVQGETERKLHAMLLPELIVRHSTGPARD